MTALLSPGVAAQGAGHWVRAWSGHFVVYSDGSPGQARHIAAQMERLRMLLHQLFPGLPLDPVAPLDVLAVRSREELEAMEPQSLQKRHDPNLIGVSQRGVDRNFVLLRLDAAADQHPLRTLYREYTSLLLERMAGPLEAWERTGVAEVLETVEISPDHAIIGEAEPDWLQTLRWHPLIPLPELTQAAGASAVHDAESWALAQMLVVHRGCRFRSAAERRCGLAENVLLALKEYVRRTSYPKLTVDLASKVNEGAIPVSSLGLAAAAAVEADFMAHSDEGERAKQLAQVALGPGGDAVRADLAMGLVALDDGDVRTARKYYCNVAASAPQDFVAAFRCGGLGARLDDAGAAADANAVACLQRAAQLRPEFAPAYDQLALFYSRRWEKMKEALRLERQALAMEPTSALYAHNLAWVEARALRYSRFEDFLDPPQAGPERQVSGTIVRVQCLDDPRGASFPIKLVVDTALGMVNLQARDYIRVPFEATNFTPPGPMNACHDLTGLHAQIKAEGNRILAVSLSR